MAVGKRLSKVAGELNVGIGTIVEFLQKKGFEVESNPNYKLSEEVVGLLEKEFRSDLTMKKESEKLGDRKSKPKKESISIDDIKAAPSDDDEDDNFQMPTAKTGSSVMDIKVVGKIDLDATKPKKKETPPPAKEIVAEAPKATPAPQPAPTKPEPPVQPKVEQKKEIEHIPIIADRIGDDIKVLGKIDLNPRHTQPKQAASDTEKAKESLPTQEKTPMPEATTEKNQESIIIEQKNNVTEIQKAEDEVFKPTTVKKLTGPTVVGKIDLPVESTRSSAERQDDKKAKKKKRKRIRKDRERVDLSGADKPAKPAGQGQMDDKQLSDKKKPVLNKGKEKGKGPHQGQGQQGAQGQGQKIKKRPSRPEVSEEDVQKQIKDTLARLTTKGKSKTSKHRRDKRDAASQRQMEEAERLDHEKNILKVTEFVTANELATLMDVPVNQVIATFMSLGLFVSINQRLDAETMSIVAEEFGYKVEFISVEMADDLNEEEDDEEDLTERPPIVTVMGHVDHGKTSLLDYIRKANVLSGEAGGITQHIGAYSVKLESGRKMTFLDTPGHEAFTAMRARGAQVTDVAIIIIAADDSIMPQTIEAINHATAANVPIIFAINKIDKPAANPDKIREALANMNYLVEEWGGKYQCQEISAKNGINIDKLLEKVLLEADILELKANPNRRAMGSVIESALDKGRGYVTTFLVQNGTLNVGDMVLSGSYYGHVKAMFNEKNQKVTSAGPSTPVLILGLNGAPQAGEKFNVLESEREAKEIANKREQLQREQGMRTKKHITLDEIGRRIAIGNFQELNVIVKGDVDGSIEALSDSLIQLSTEEIQVNVIHKAVGQISESDIMLAAASNAIVIGFQVRPSLAAKRLAEKEEIDIRLYSIIYDAIEEIKSAMEGMLSPEIKETIVATLEIQETFKINKVGTIAGCMVKEGKIKRTNKVRIIRDGIVIYTGELGSLKRFKDDAKEVVAGLECGLNIKNFNDIKNGDLVEAFEETEIMRKL